MSKTVVLQREKVKTFSYKSSPRNVTVKLEKNGTQTNYGNIMYDRRVVRGNTWAMRRMAQEQMNTELLKERQINKVKRQKVRKEVKEKLEKNGLLKPSSASSTPDTFVPNVPEQQTPPHYKGSIISTKNRKKLRTSISKAKTSQTSTISTVKEPAKVDRSAQVSKDMDPATDLAVAVLVDSVLTETVRELQNEQEMLEVKEQQRKLEEARNCDLTKIQQLEEKIDHASSEKNALMIERSLMEQRERARLANEITRKYLDDDLIPNVLFKMDQAGYLKPSVQTESASVDTRHLEARTLHLSKICEDIITDFLPWVYTRADAMAKHEMLDKNLTDALFCTDKSSRDDAMKRLETTLEATA